mmetsp:Transcript_12223/g.30089  ORF Transcript_12223/g.30089 Transcript_12223/m.30089 type:complete len:105 (-) Transcript_12223:133-447(-)
MGLGAQRGWKREETTELGMHDDLCFARASTIPHRRLQFWFCPFFFGFLFSNLLPKKSGKTLRRETCETISLLDGMWQAAQFEPAHTYGRIQRLDDVGSGCCERK